MKPIIIPVSNLVQREDGERGYLHQKGIKELKMLRISFFAQMGSEITEEF
jgi:hypothetical protein